MKIIYIVQIFCHYYYLLSVQRLVLLSGFALEFRRKGWPKVFDKFVSYLHAMHRFPSSLLLKMTKSFLPFHKQFWVFLLHEYWNEGPFYTSFGTLRWNGWQVYCRNLHHRDECLRLLIWPSQWHNIINCSGFCFQFFHALGDLNYYRLLQERASNRDIRGVMSHKTSI